MTYRRIVIIKIFYTEEKCSWSQIFSLGGLEAGNKMPKTEKVHFLLRILANGTPWSLKLIDENPISFFGPMFAVEHNTTVFLQLTNVCNCRCSADGLSVVATPIYQAGKLHYNKWSVLQVFWQLVGHLLAFIFSFFFFILFYDSRVSQWLIFIFLFFFLVWHMSAKCC